MKPIRSSRAPFLLITLLVLPQLSLAEIQKETPYVTTESGLKYIDIKLGAGDSAQAGQIIVVHYEGWLLDGTKFDSSRDREQPFEFTIGEGTLIKGWEEGIMGMKVGGMRRLVIPPHLGYGSRDLGIIPPRSTLIFEIELLNVKSPTP